MPQGVQVFNSSGGIEVEITDRLARVIGTLSTGGGSGSYTVPGVGSHSVWIIASYYTRFVSAEDVTSVSAAGDTISWTGNGDMEVLYGVS